MFWELLIIYKHYCFKTPLHLRNKWIKISLVLITSSVNIWALPCPKISFYWKRFDGGKCKECNITVWDSFKIKSCFWVTLCYNVCNMTEIFSIVLLFYLTIFVIVFTYLQVEILMWKGASQLLYLRCLCKKTVGRMSFC